MKKALLAVIATIFLVATPALAGEKEELALKRDLYRERLTRITLEFQIVQTRAAELQREFPDVQKQLAEAEKQLAAVEAKPKQLDAVKATE